MIGLYWFVAGASGHVRVRLAALECSCSAALSACNVCLGRGAAGGGQKGRDGRAEAWCVAFLVLLLEACGLSVMVLLLGRVRGVEATVCCTGAAHSG